MEPGNVRATSDNNAMMSAPPESVRHSSADGISAKLNDIDPRAWLADVLARLPDHPAKRVNELLPWN